MLSVRAKPRWIERLLPLFAGFVQVMGTQGVEWNQSDRVPVDPLGNGLLLVGPLALFARRRHPVPVLLVTVVVTCVFILRGHAYGPVFISPIIAAYNAVMLGHRRVVAATWSSPTRSSSSTRPGWPRRMSPAGSTTSRWPRSWGSCWRWRSSARVRRERLAERERTEAEEARRQASEERLRIARELHDVLAHNISLIHVQASIALHLIDDHPEQARTALTTIKEASKEALGEMRSVLDVLRDDEAPRSPAAGLDRLDELIERSRARRSSSRSPARSGPLPPGVDRAGYRIVQEALTNVTRHAPRRARSRSARVRRRARCPCRSTDSGGATARRREPGSGNGIARHARTGRGPGWHADRRHHCGGLPGRRRGCRAPEETA